MLYLLKVLSYQRFRRDENDRKCQLEYTRKKKFKKSKSNQLFVLLLISQIITRESILPSYSIELSF